MNRGWSGWPGCRTYHARGNAYANPLAPGSTFPKPTSRGAFAILPSDFVGIVRAVDAIIVRMMSSKNFQYQHHSSGSQENPQHPQASSATAPLSRASRVPPASHSTLADPKNTPGNQSKAHVSSDQSSEQPPTPVTPLRPTSVLKSRAFPTKARLRHHFLAWLFQASATVDRAGGREMEAKKPFGVIRADPSARQRTRIHL